MSSFSLILFLIGVLCGVVTLIWSLINLIRKKSPKKVLIIFGGSLVLAIFGIILNPSSHNSTSTATTVAVKTVTPEVKLTAAQIANNKKIADAKVIEDKKVAAAQAIKNKKIADAKAKADAQAIKDAEAKKTAGKMTKAKFTEIQNGMNYAEVTKIMGGPGEVLSESGSKGDAYYTVMYEYEGIGSIGSNSSLMFQGNKLMNKTQIGLK